MAQVLQCDVAVVRVTNLDVLDLPPGSSSSSSHLFVRYYVAIGGGKRIRVDTRKLPCTGEEARWDERASLECRGSSTANPLKEVLLAGGRSSSTVVFELRCRRSATTVWGKAAGSRLLGRGEVAWSDAIDSPDMSVETWVRLATSTKKKKNQKLKQPVALLVRMGVRVEVSETVSVSITAQKIRRRGRQQWWDADESCKCGSCGWVGSEEDMFLSATTAASMRP